MSRFYQILLVVCLAVALCSAEAPHRYRSRNGRLQLSRQRNRFLARQEVAADEAGVTPYPSAKELIPDIPFDESASAADAPEVPVESEEPLAPEDDSVNIRLPVGQEPVEEEVDETVAADDAQGEREPDLVYGPPETEDVPTVNEIPVEEIEETIAEEEEQAEEQFQSGRLISGRRRSARPAKLRAARPAKLRAPTPFSARSTSAKSNKSARLVKAKATNKARIARLQQLQQQPQFFVPQQFAAQQQQQQPVFYYTAAQLQQW